MTDPIPDLTAALAGRYRIERELGAGGMARVYLAEDLRHSRRVALKAFLPELSQTVGAGRFAREIEVTARLTHPNILPLLDSGEAGGTLFYVMPLVEGETLANRLEREPQLPLHDALVIVGQVAEALAYAHDQGVVHRDVKPANILLLEGQAVVADFGIAKALHVAGGEALTQTGLVMGTPLYMSPEQSDPAATVDGRADVYALGCVFYEMLVGEPPFTGPTMAAIMARHAVDPVPPLATVRSAIPRSVDRVLRTALAKSPADRFATPREFAEALREAAEAGDAGEAGLAAAADRATARRPRVNGTRIATALGGVAGLTILGWWAVGGGAWPPGAGAGLGRIAVLPVDFTAAPEASPLAGGVHNSLIGALGRRGMTVVGRGSVARFTSAEAPAERVAGELGVDAVLESVVVPTADGLQIQALLLDGDDGTVTWSGEFQAPLEGLVTAMGSVAADLVADLGLELSAPGSARIGSIPDAAREPLARGYALLATLTPPGLDSAMTFFEQALQIDPELAEAHAGVASVWGYRAQMGFVPPYEAGPEAVAALREAMRLDTLNAPTQAIRAVLSTWREWDWTEAEAGFRRTLELDPGDARTRAFYAHYLAIVGRPEESLTQIDSALAMDPYDFLIQGLRSVNLMLVHRDDEALQAARATLEAFPGHPLAGITLRGLHHERGEWEAAFEAARTETAGRGDTALVAALDAGWAEGGYRAAMRRGAEEMEARAEREYVAPSQVYELYFAAGMIDEAIEWLERGFDARDPNLPYLSVLRPLDPYRDDPRLQSLIRRMNYPGSAGG